MSALRAFRASWSTRAPSASSRGLGVPGHVRTVASAGGGWEFYGGRSETKTNYQLNELPKEKREEKIKLLGFTKWPAAVVKSLKSEYLYRPNQKDPLTFYHVRAGAAAKEESKMDFAYIGSTELESRNSRTIENALHQNTRGYGVQIILEGKGVKAYFEPKFPYLNVRLGVGSKATDLTEYCNRDPGITITTTKAGDIITLEGPTKERVGTLAYRIFCKLKANPYTGRGAHLALNPAKRKTVKKK
eukprot:GEMP01048187.1.p1 GENE.GEMP01048187.1~~GEMP01048187.1.p1  ORF type:complete len:245 (+),score=43.60 GEMP01048187.1:192-926(+)